MASTIFESVCDEIESRTPLSRLEARGTVRLALKSAGLEVESVSADQMSVVLERVLPVELEKRGVRNAADVCGPIARTAAAANDAPGAETPEAVFQRMAGD